MRLGRCWGRGGMRVLGVMGRWRGVRGRLGWFDGGGRGMKGGSEGVLLVRCVALHCIALFCIHDWRFGICPIFYFIF